MGLFQGLKDVAGFLTVLPVKTDEESLANTANHMYLFPLLGGFIGLLAGGLAWLLLHFLPPIIVGVLTIGFILIFTGFHHTDGLLDFGDGLMLQGSPEQKIKVMHDNHVGTGAFSLALIVILTSILCISQMPQYLILQSLIISEGSAKFSMVFLAKTGKSAHHGLNTYFINAMRKHYGLRQIVIATGISLVITTFLLGVWGAIILAAGITASLVILGISNRHFRGVTGDVFGAANDISRMASLLTVLLVVRWV